MSERYDAALVRYERMESLMKEYVGKCTELYADSVGRGMGNYLRKVVTGWDSYSASPIHVEYFNEMKEAAESLAGELEPLAAEDRKGAAELAGKAVRLLLEPASDDIRHMEVAFMADDQHADGLLRFLSDEDLREVFGMIEKDREHMRAVPSQQKTFGLLKDEMKARGMEIPATGFMARLKARFSRTK